MRIGASVWPFKWAPPYEDAIARIARLGFKAIELIAWNRETLNEYYTPQRIRDLRNRIAGEGLVLSEFVSTPPGMASPDRSARDASVEHFKKLVAVGVELGTPIVNTVSAYPFGIEFPRITDRPFLQELRTNLPTGLNWQQNWQDYVDLMRRCAGICEEAGVKYALEPHPFRYMSNAASMLRLIEHVASPTLGMNLDPSHLFPVGELAEVVVYQLGQRVFHCHFSDNDGTTNAHWRPGKGKIDWEAVMRALKDTGFNGVISIELEDVPGVARGGVPLRGARHDDGTASVEFEQENRAAMNYIKNICQRLDIAVA